MPIDQVPAQAVDAALAGCRRILEHADHLNLTAWQLISVAGAAAADTHATALTEAERAAHQCGRGALLDYAQETAVQHLLSRSPLCSWPDPEPALHTMKCAVAATILGDAIDRDLRDRLLAPLKAIGGLTAPPRG